VTAIYERHGDTRIPSTRYRDLVDLVAIATDASITAGALRAAIVSEFERRGLPIPQRFDVPDRALWGPGYAAEARRCLLKAGQTVDQAVAIVGPFIDPVLIATSSGVAPRHLRVEVAVGRGYIRARAGTERGQGNR
jgi:hypothetical protein